MMLSAVALAAEEEVSQSLNWTIGGSILAVLVLVLIALVAFGGGREHS